MKRREFIAASAALAATSLLPETPAWARGRTLRLGLIGTGMRGQVLLKELQSLCLNVEVLSTDGAAIEMRDGEDEDLERAAANLGINLSKNEAPSVDDVVN